MIKKELQCSLKDYLKKLKIEISSIKPKTKFYEVIYNKYKEELDKLELTKKQIEKELKL